MSPRRANDTALLRLAAAASLATGTIGYIAVRSQRAYAADHDVRRAMRRRSTRRRDRAAELISLVGEPSAQIPLSVLAGALVAWQRGGRATDAVNFAPTAAVGAAIGAHHAIKAAFPRKRPLSARLSGKTEPSYPSGHAATMTALSATTAMLMTRRAQTRRGRHSAATRATRASILAAAVSAPAIVGLARVYAGKHWASDVVGGWTLGIGIAASACWVAETLDRMQQRR